MFRPVGLHICVFVYLNMFKVFQYLCVTMFEVPLKMCATTAFSAGVQKGNTRNGRERGRAGGGRRMCHNLDGVGWGLLGIRVRVRSNWPTVNYSHV